MRFKLVYILQNLEHLTGIADRSYIDTRKIVTMINLGTVQVNVMHSELGSHSVYVTKAPERKK